MSKALLKTYLIQYQENIKKQAECEEIATKESKKNNYEEAGSKAVHEKSSLEKEQTQLARKIAELVNEGATGEKKCKNCEETGMAELEERVTNLEKKKDSKRDNEQDKGNKTMMNIVFYGAVAGGISAICGLAQFVMGFFKKSN